MNTILLIEDQESNRRLLRELLSMRFLVAEASSAEEALQILESFIPDLILLDIQLPGLDGLSLLRALRANPITAGIRVVVLSSHSLPLMVSEAREAGCLDFIPKPIGDDPVDFLDRVSAYLHDEHWETAGSGAHERWLPCR